MKSAAIILKENKAWAEEIYAKLDKKLRKMAVRSKGLFADGVDENGRHIDVPWVLGWTNGFWGGLNALMYEHTRAEEYLACAKAVEERLDEALIDRHRDLYHDTGFMWHILSGTIARVLDDKKSEARNLIAANALAARYNVDGGFITAWNGKERQNWTIIDTMMNLPQLYWAGRVLDDDRYERLAKAHADMAMVDHLREDGSVNHIVVHDRETGEFVKSLAGQGYAEGSSWSRGQSWAVYGFVLSYLHTKEERYLTASKLAANYFIANCCDDWLPRVDFRAPETPVYYDSTAGMIAACGMIELAKILPENEGGMYMNAAINLLKSVEKSFGNWDEDVDYIIGKGSVRYPTVDTINVNGKLLDEKEAGIHISIIYGDYYFAEAILKLIGSEFNPW